MQAIKKARKLLSDPKKFCKNAWAEDKDGYSVSFWEKSACRWCAVGALKKYGATDEEMVAVSSEAFNLYRVSAIPCINDSPRGRLKILRIFDRVINAAKL